MVTTADRRSLRIMTLRSRVGPKGSVQAVWLARRRSASHADRGPAPPVDQEIHPLAIEECDDAVDAGKGGERTGRVDVCDADPPLEVLPAGPINRDLTRDAAAIAPGHQGELGEAHDPRAIRMRIRLVVCAHCSMLSHQLEGAGDGDASTIGQVEI
jgi:hypothetical protein